ncbi:MAG: hypothetical protein IJ581_00780 [Paludibacteraceae bacterium]|nr:hypothetical protein [Paludibacteraceae bacterium]
MDTKLVKGLFYGFSAMLTGVLAFFIIYHAGWITGDDAIVVRTTGWGHFFNPADTVTPSTGRFYPFAYIIYNVLPILGLHSINAHFALHMLVFVLFCVVSLWACYKAVDTKQLTWQDNILALSAAVVCIARAYCNFLDAYSTIWVDYTLVMIWVLCCYYVHAKQSKAALIIGLLSVTYLTYCLETNFVFPLSYGILGLLFMWKKSTKLEKTYLWSLIGVGVLFLLLYFFICFLHIEEAYDGAHGQNITVIGNAIKMFLAQKVLWVVLILVYWRAYCIFIKKEEYEFWDTILLTGCAYCCGCAVMKLNWVLYYSLASLFMVPAIVYYLRKYLGSKWAWIIMLALALFTFRKVPEYIITYQKGRKGTAETVEALVNQYNAGSKLYWYAPEDDREWCFDLETRAWLHACLQTLFAYEVEQEQYEFRILKTFDGQSGTYILPCENNKLFPNINDTVISAGKVLKDGDLRSFTIVQVQ